MSAVRGGKPGEEVERRSPYSLHNFSVHLTSPKFIFKFLNAPNEAAVSRQGILPAVVVMCVWDGVDTRMSVTTLHSGGLEAP